jgi:dynein heavy chain
VLETLNESATKRMNLVLFQDALEHVTRIHRIMRIPRGNALLGMCVWRSGGWMDEWMKS